MHTFIIYHEQCIILSHNTSPDSPGYIVSYYIYYEGLFHLNVYRRGKTCEIEIAGGGREKLN